MKTLFKAGLYRLERPVDADGIGGVEKFHVHLTATQARALFAIAKGSDPRRGVWRGDSLAERLGFSGWELED